MRYVTWAIAAAFCFTLFSSSAFAQRKKVKQLETKVQNLETDLEVLQEFIQEQSAALQELKKKLAETEKWKEELGKVDKRVAGNTDLAKKIHGDVGKVTGKVQEDSDRVDKVEEQLAKKKVDFHGQIRVRPEILANHQYFNNLMTDDRNFTGSHRARIGIDVNPNDFFTGRFTLQDARIWGSPTLYLQKESVANPPQDRDSGSALKVHEAYVNMNLKDVAVLRLGRQMWNFGAGRIVGNNDWEQAGRSFDGLDLALKYQNYIRADMFFAWVEERHSSGETDASFGGLYLTCPYVEDMAFDLYYFFLYDTKGAAKRSISTLGLRIGGKLPWHKALFFDMEGAIQFGTATEGQPRDFDTVENDHYAVSLHVDLGYAIQVKTTPTLALFFDMASGDGNTSPQDEANDLSAGWIPLFPTNHGMFGKMDLWNQTNIWDFGGFFKISPVDGFDIVLELHSLHIYADTGAIPGGGDNISIVEATDTNLGFEMDFELIYRIRDNLAVMGGYSFFSPGQALEDRDKLDPLVLTEIEDGDEVQYRYPVGDAAHWAYLQVDLTF